MQQGPCHCLCPGVFCVVVTMRPSFLFLWSFRLDEHCMHGDGGDMQSRDMVHGASLIVCSGECF